MLEILTIKTNASFFNLYFHGKCDLSLTKIMSFNDKHKDEGLFKVGAFQFFVWEQLYFGKFEGAHKMRQSVDLSKGA